MPRVGVKALLPLYQNIPILRNLANLTAHPTLPCRLVGAIMGFIDSILNSPGITGKLSSGKYSNLGKNKNKQETQA